MKFSTFVNREIGAFHSKLYLQTSVSVNMHYYPLLKFMIRIGGGGGISHPLYESLTYIMPTSSHERTQHNTCASNSHVHQIDVHTYLVPMSA